MKEDEILYKCMYNLTKGDKYYEIIKVKIVLKIVTYFETRF